MVRQSKLLAQVSPPLIKSLMLSRGPGLTASSNSNYSPPYTTNIQLRGLSLQHIDSRNIIKPQQIILLPVREIAMIKNSGCWAI